MLAGAGGGGGGGVKLNMTVRPTDLFRNKRLRLIKPKRSTFPE